MQKAARHVNQNIKAAAGIETVTVSFGDDKAKTKNRPGKPVAQATWRGVAVDLASYALITAFLTSIHQLLLGHFLGDRLTEFAANYPLQSIQFDLTPLYTSYANQNAVTIMLQTLLGGVAGVALLFIQAGILHVFATRVFDGYGTLRDLIRRSHSFFIGGSVVYVIYSFFYTYLLTAGIIDFSEAFYDGQNIMLYNQQITLFVLGNVLMMLIFIGGWSALWSRIVARNYEFSAVRGCGAIFMTIIVEMIFGCMLGFVITMASFSSIVTSCYSYTC